MTLLPMENRESILCALKSFSKELSLNIPPLLEDYMQHISRNGQTMLPWVFVKPLILQKYNIVVESLSGDAVSNEVEELKQRVFGVLKRLDGIPFTIQRICELLCAPNRQYTRLDKYLRGFEKVCRVVSTVDPRGNKIHHEDPRFPSQAGLEECMTDDSLLSANTSPSDGDEVTDEDSDNVSSTGVETLLDSAETAVDAPIPTPTSPVWQITSNTTPVSLTQSTGERVITSPPSSEAEPPLLRPIGQLEAFVQNIAAEIPVPSSSCAPAAACGVSSANNASSLMASSIASMQMELSEHGDSLELKEPSDATVNRRSVGDGGSEQHSDSELSHRSPVASLKRRAPVSVDEALSSSLGSLVEEKGEEEEEPALPLVPDGAAATSLLELTDRQQQEGEGEDEADQQLETIESPAKRRRIDAVAGGGGGETPPLSLGRTNLETAESCDKPTAGISSPSSSLSNGSPPTIVCSRPDASLPGNSSSAPTEASAANNAEESGVVAAPPAESPTTQLG